ncbi:sphingoid long chain base kinase 4, variant [Neurospora crassa OR74A]|uniref:Sphingoid long chain base kinase 4, variant n=1 Tax=Neurospora crassa (strain ATCC 24698 / 74-OR23-1A / CBS 708.71 / DSM 1257 / FGSC 987) TaxID=367110 RepID=V5IM88_NEUCR|nr:sphingoid long chain base kinase 4, variant [Neurospora crassa OR74A]ESA42797.1 sphingoid long chain base kinase 4, variant [Neurospora crassa OR74A]|eukprot:XP_011394279.1 sphingoid long chain base kinase 4, variant [Neurospora crassa OR74A]
MGDVRQLRDEHAAAIAKASAQEPSIQAVALQATTSASGKNVAILELPTVTLTCEKDHLVIQEHTAATKKSLTPSRRLAPGSVPFYNILWAYITPDRNYLRIDFAEETSPKKHQLIVRQLEFPLPSASLQGAREREPLLSPPSIPPVSAATLDAFVARVLDLAYPAPIQRRKRAWVLVNPHAGPGGADKIFEKKVRPIFEAARMPLTVVRTTYSGEAVTLAQDLDISEYDIAIPCSGDGLPHEVFNGLSKRPDARKALAKLAVCHIPCGSGNAMSCNLYGTHRPSLAALAIVKGVPTKLDLCSVTLQDGERLTSFLSQAYGLIADLDITTEHLRWMGAARFTYGFLTLAIRKKTYPCDVAMKVEVGGKEEIRGHYARGVKGAESDVGNGEASGDGEEGGSSDGEGEGEGEGMPGLKYGTVNDKLPEDWEVVPHEKLGSFYCGNMAYMAPDANFFSAALANDGLLDLITTDGDISLWKNINLQLSVESGHFFDNPLVSYRKVSAFRLTPRYQDPNGVISIDGEARPFAPFQVEVHKGLGLTLSKRGVFEAPGPHGWDKVTTTERLMA